MEEILASIRRIIADEEKPAPPPEPAAAADDDRISEEDLDKLFASTGDDEPEAAAEPEDGVLDLTEEAVAEPAELVDAFSPEEDDLQFADPEPEPEPAPVPEPPPARLAPPPPPPKPAFVPPPPPPRDPAPAVDAPRLISDASERAVASAFDDLSMTILNRNARTLEDLVQDMLRPMLKTWLDQNLPGMVERLVRAEIERVSRGR